MRLLIVNLCLALPALAQQPQPVPVPVPDKPAEPVAAPAPAPAPAPPPAPAVAAPTAPPAKPLKLTPLDPLPQRVQTKKKKAPDAKPSKKGKAEIGVHAFGMAVGSFLSEVDDDKKFAMIDGQRVQVVYPGFGGFGGGGGLMLDVSYRGIIGVQLGFYGTRGGASGSINDIDFEIVQNAFHLPVLLKAAIPTDSVRPYLFLGPEFVFPGDPEVDEDTPGGVAVAATADTYGVFTFGFGFEFMLPVDGMDVRLPFNLRGLYNPGYGNNLDGRATYTADGDVLTGATFVTEWEWQAAVSLGLAFYFHPGG